MAVTISSGPNTINDSAQITAPASVKGGWSTINSDAKTAQSAANLISPLACTDAAVYWVKVPDRATRAVFRTKFASTLTSMTTQAVVRVYGIDTDLTTAPLTDGTQKPMRLDNASPSATGVTLTITGAATDISDGTNRYGQPHSLTGLDCMGSRFIACFIETAAVINAGSGTISVEVMFLN